MVRSQHFWGVIKTSFGDFRRMFHESLFCDFIPTIKYFMFNPTQTWEGLALIGFNINHIQKWGTITQIYTERARLGSPCTHVNDSLNLLKGWTSLILNH